MELEIVAFSRKGGRSYNEDAYGQWNDGHFAACVVADGAGGHGGGDVASMLARNTLLQQFAQRPAVLPERIQELLREADDVVRVRQADGQALARMRSTAVLLAMDVQRDQFVYGHCGDSRLYAFREGRLLLRSTDHSLVQQLVASGALDDEGARQHPRRNVLLSALGAPAGELELSVSGVLPLRDGDQFLLCSDGVWELMPDERITQIVCNAQTPSLALQDLEREVVQLADEQHDNFTAVLVSVQAESQLTLLIPPKVTP
jgi:serine/threonine protein phosphatase PrpC